MISEELKHCDLQFRYLIGLKFTVIATERVPTLWHLHCHLVCWCLTFCLTLRAGFKGNLGSSYKCFSIKEKDHKFSSIFRKINGIFTVS